MRYVGRLDQEQIGQAQQDSHALWGGGLALPERLGNVTRLMQAVGPARLHLEGLVDGRGRVVASMKRYTFQLCRPGTTTPVPAIGVGAVFTPDEHRGRGYATRLLEDVMGAARGEGFAAAILYSDIAPAFYERLGYRQWPAAKWSAAAASLPDREPLALRPMAPTEHAAVVAWYAQAWPADWLRLARDATTWELQWAINGRPALYALAEARGSGTGRDVGYLAVADAAGGGLWIEEWCVPQTLRASLAPRVLAAVRGLAAAGSTVAAWLRPDDPTALFTALPRTRAVPMLASLTPALAVESLPTDRAHFGSLDHV